MDVFLHMNDYHKYHFTNCFSYEGKSVICARCIFVVSWVS